MGDKKFTFVMTKTLFIGLVLLVISVIILLQGTMQKKTVNDACNFDTLTAENLTEGQYVNCVVDSYLVKKNYDTATYNGNVELIVEFPNEYYTYAVMMEDGRYVMLRIKDIDTQYILKHYSWDREMEDQPFLMASGQMVTFKGKIEAITKYNEKWFDEIADFDKSLVVTDYVISEVKDDERHGMSNLQYIGFIGIVIAFIFITKGGSVEKHEKAKVDYKAIYEENNKSAGQEEKPAPTYFTAMNPSWDNLQQELDKELEEPVQEQDVTGETAESTEVTAIEAEETEATETSMVGTAAEIAEPEETDESAKPEEKTEAPKEE